MDLENVNTLFEIIVKIIRLIYFLRKYCEYKGIVPYECIKNIYKRFSKENIKIAIWISAFWILLG